jgi:PTS system mannitol-specific IIA component
MDLPVLNEKNILINVKTESKMNAIERAGNLLVEKGYVEKGYIDGMKAREEEVTTYIGNGIAIPHGMNKYVKYIKNSGIVIIQYPEGVDFGEGNTAYLVIGIAGKNNDHIKLDLMEANPSSTVLCGIAFSQSRHLEMIKQSLPFDICYVVTENEYRGKTYLQLNVKDIRWRNNQELI